MCGKPEIRRTGQNVVFFFLNKSRKLNQTQPHN